MLTHALGEPSPRVVARLAAKGCPDCPGLQGALRRRGIGADSSIYATAPLLDGCQPGCFARGALRSWSRWRVLPGLTAPDRENG